MKHNILEKTKALFDKIKNLKHIKVIAVVILGLLLVGCYYLSIDNYQENTTSTEKIDNSTQNFSSSAEYTSYLENKLKSVISSLKGVGETEVVITLEKGFEYIYQTKDETKTLSNGTSLTTSEIVLVDGQPLIIEEIYPVVKGVIVIAQGSDNVATKLDIINIIQTVIEIDASKISIKQGK